jgi:hypothetical protein
VSDSNDAYTDPIIDNKRVKDAKVDEQEANNLEELVNELDDLSRLVYELNKRDYAKYLAVIATDKPRSIAAIEDGDWQESIMDCAESVSIHSIEAYVDDELFDFGQDLVYCPPSYEDG